MTEAEWLAAAEPVQLLEFVGGAAPARKLRLFAALCLRIYLEFRADRCDGVLPHWADVTERYADGLATFDEWDRARSGVHGAFHAADPYRQAASEVGTALFGFPDGEAGAPHLARCARDIFGNPFRPVTFLPAWRTYTAIVLAGQMYESRDFSAMPILADAFQDAGCEKADILDHCRGPGPHVRGCWVVDSVLGKE